MPVIPQTVALTSVLLQHYYTAFYDNLYSPQMVEKNKNKLLYLLCAVSVRVSVSEHVCPLWVTVAVQTNTWPPSCKVCVLVVEPGSPSTVHV